MSDYWNITGPAVASVFFFDALGVWVIPVFGLVSLALQIIAVRREDARHG